MHGSCECPYISLSYFGGVAVSIYCASICGQFSSQNNEIISGRCLACPDRLGDPHTGEVPQLEYVVTGFHRRAEQGRVGLTYP